MNYQSDCSCGGECKKPCIAGKQLKKELRQYKQTQTEKEKTKCKMVDR
jgi:hypothetical protein